MMQRVQARGEAFSLYISPSYDGSAVPPHWNQPQEYAEYAEAFVKWIRGQSPGSPGCNITPNYWAIYNEPNLMSPAPTSLSQLTVAVGQRFQTIGVSTKVQTTEFSVPDPSALNTILGNASARPFVGFVSFHGYDYDNLPMPSSFSTRNQIRNTARANNLRTGMTEICCRSGWTNGSYSQVLGWARDIYWNMTEADISAWEPLSIMFTCDPVGCPNGGGDPIMINRDFSSYFKFASYYGLRQYARNIRPGHVRVGLQCSNCGFDPSTGQDVKPVAFRSAAGKYVVVVINDSASSQDVYFSGFPAGTYNVSGMDPNNTTPVTFPAQTIGAGENIRITFPARALVTFVQQ
jgi:O-glycosyl hydrolase